jgi:RNA polymerase sigma factor (sigma-70 family)
MIESMMPYNEQDMLVQLATGDEKAFTVIYNQYWKKLYYLAYKHIKVAETAEEIVQEVFLALWKQRASANIQSLPVYLAAVTRYKMYQLFAAQKKYKQTTLSHLETEPRADDAATALEHKLLLEIIEQLSSRLPEKCRLVFVYNKLLDQPLAQVAAELNISNKTAEAHLTKALKVIRGNLGDALNFLLFI